MSLRFVSQGALLPAHTKTVFLGDIAKYEGQTVTDFFAVAQKQFSRKRDGAAYLSLRLTDRTANAKPGCGTTWRPAPTPSRPAKS